MEAFLQTVSVAANKAFTAIKIEHTNNVIDKMVKFMGEKMEMDEDALGWFEEFCQKMVAEVEADAPKVPKGVAAKIAKDAAGTGRKSKDPNAPLKKLTAVNMFIQEKMGELKEAGASTETGSYFKQATVMWNSLSDEEKAEYKEEIKEKLDALNEERQNSPEAFKKAKKEKAAAAKKEKAAATDAEKPAKEPKTPGRKKAPEPVFEIPQAKKFVEMMEDVKLPATEVKKAKVLLASICADMKEEMGDEEIDNIMFVETIKTLFEDKKVLYGKKAGEKLLKDFEEAMNAETVVEDAESRSDETEVPVDEDVDEDGVYY